jgi:hypothetical protein
VKIAKVDLEAGEAGEKANGWSSTVQKRDKDDFNKALSQPNGVGREDLQPEDSRNLFQSGRRCGTNG